MKNKKILITGGLGYIGMELAKLYSGQSRICKTTVIDNKFYASRVSQLKRWGINFIQGDILDDELIKNLLEDVDIVYHLAGITDVGTTLDDVNKKRDIEIKKIGVKGTKNIIDNLSNDSKIVFPSTHVIFEGLKNKKTDIDEAFNPVPVLEYAKGKYQSEQDIINSGKNYVILRLGSVYGISGDSTRINIMPNLFSKITSEDGTLKLYAKGKQLKSLVSVKDVSRSMMFSGENENIKREIFNIVNENITVKDVAEICKKNNKKLDIVYTTDPVPNEGYSLSNKKIKSFGFKFLYNIKHSVKEFIDNLENPKIITENELLDQGRDNFIDDRGIISNFYFPDLINMIGYVESKKHSIRGNHYHPVQTQKCLLIKGKYISVTKDLLSENSVVETRLISEGELSTIPPNVAHTMVFLEDSIFLNLVNGEREHKNYGMTHTKKYDLVNENFGHSLIENYKTECRVCGGGLNHYLSLGLSPLANNLNSKKDTKSELYPLDLNFCKKCSNSQLSIVVPPEKMFSNYFYLSSTSNLFRNHFAQIAKELKADLKLSDKTLVIDIGSNDGIFIEPLKKLGIKAVGVEPAKNVAKIANSNGFETLSEYFDNKTVEKIYRKYGKATVITAFNVFAHNDDLKGILKNVEKLLNKDGEFIFEIQYMLKTIKDLTFDNIYHEHVNYWCLLSILHFFEDSLLKVYKVQEVDTHGGSLRIYTSKNKNKKVDKSVGEYVEYEKKNKLDKIETYYKFAKKVEKVKSLSLIKIKELVKDGKTIIGYGAPAKATTLLNYFGIDEQYIKYVIDDSEIKHNKYIPGVNLKILNSNNKIIDNVDYVIVLAWNFFDEIVEKNKEQFPKSKFIKIK